MNYAKVIGSALQLFPKKINITLIESGSERLLGKFKVPSALLPQAFDRPTTLHINNTDWRVMAASPLSADDFLYSKKLQLHVLPVSHATPDRFYWPTRCDWTPVEAITFGPAADPPVMIDQRDWLQLQFLPLQQASEAEAALSNIRSILKKESNPLLGYEQQYVRTGIGEPGLAIPWDECWRRLSNPRQVNIALETGRPLQDGFCITTDSYTYYGIRRDHMIESMGIVSMEYVDEELMNVLAAFGLELVDWCRVSRISAEAGEKPADEYVNL